MRILVTGASGFLGRHLVTELTSHGHEVVALSRKGSEAREHVVVRRGDVLDAGSVKDAAAGCEVVMHCAGKVSRDPNLAEELHRVHVTGTKTALAACKKAGVRRAVIASSSGTIAVSADPDAIGTETDETPIALINKWPYYRAKLFAERAALEMSSKDFEVVSINPTLLLGPGDREGSSTTDIRLFLERKIPAVPPGGVSYVDARDAAVAMRLAIEQGRPGERYLIGACNLTIRELFGRLERLSGVKAPMVPMPRAPGLSRTGAELLGRALGKVGLKLPVDPVSLEMSQYTWYLDSAKAEAELGWSSRDPMDTLAETVKDLRERGVVWPEA